MKPGGTTKTRDRASGLDGVRALAVLTVIGFHEGASGLPGGFLGVGQVTAVGDSVMLASAAALEAALPGVYIDAKIDR